MERGLFGLSTCTVITALISLAILIWGFVMIFRKKEMGDSDVKQVSEQIKGFGLVLLSMYVLTIGISICVGGYGLYEYSRF
jgi:hypothetical protein